MMTVIIAETQKTTVMKQFIISIIIAALETFGSSANAVFPDFVSLF